MQLKKPIKSLNGKDWLGILLLSILLFVVFVFYNNSDFVIPGEEDLLTKLDVADEMVMASGFKSPYDFVFINVGKDLELVKDEEGGDNVITDRNKLGSFLKILVDSNRHRFLLCDIVFDLPSPNDSLFRQYILGLQRAVFPKHFGDSAPITSLFPLPLAVADFHTNTGKFNKFRLVYHDTDQTIPVTLHEQLQKVKYTKKYGNLFCNGKLCLQTISPKYYIRSYQLTDSKTYPFFNLGELLVLSNEPSFYKSFLENKFIVIGNFNTDIHDTPVGKMPGTLVLLNTYLNLFFSRQLISVWWVITFFSIFFLINLYLIHGVLDAPQVIRKKSWWANIANSVLVKLFSLAGLCIGIALLSELVFGVQCQVFSVLFFILVVNFLLNLCKPK